MRMKDKNIRRFLWYPAVLILDLPFLECQTIVKDSITSYMLWVRLEDYGKLVTDEGGHLRRDFFDSDGWDFLSANKVNVEIERTLADPEDLWTQNNGVTLIASNVTVQGKSMRLQIINGLEITQIICRHFQGLATAKDENLLVKIIVTSDVQTRDMIIKSMSYPGQPVTDFTLPLFCPHKPR
jgi:hypothetical protein